jgi:predicted kinase
METLTVLVGAPGVGKSTTAKDMAERYGDLIVDIDKIVEMLHGKYTGYNDTLKPLYKAIELSIVQNALLYGQSVIIDRCCQYSSTRKRWRDIGRQFGARTHRVLVTADKPIEERAKRRFDLDGRGYSEEHWIQIMRERENQFEQPVDSEGFDCESILRSPHTE